MDPIELHIGNLVFVDNEEYHPQLKDVPLRVIGITLNGKEYAVQLEHINQKPNTYYDTYSQFIRFIKPIPLTEDRLVKLKFKNEFGEEWFEAKGLYAIEKFYDGYAYTAGEGCALCERFNSVHELQNHYFDTTKKKLEYEEIN